MYEHNELLDTYVASLENLEQPNSSLYITFSAVPGSGKTWLARQIAKHFSGLYLAADDVRSVATQLWPDISREELDNVIVACTPKIQDRLLPYSNHLHIVDTNIDRYAQQVIDKTRQIHFPLYIIRLDVELDVLKARISHRTQNNFQNQDIYYHRCRRNYTIMKPFYRCTVNK